MATYIVEDASSDADTSLIPPVAVLRHIEEVNVLRYPTYAQLITARKLAEREKQKVEGIMDKPKPEKVTAAREQKKSTGKRRETETRESDSTVLVEDKKDSKELSLHQVLNARVMEFNLSQQYFHRDFRNPAYNSTVIVRGVDFNLPRHILSQELPQYNSMLFFARKALPLEGAIAYEAPECNEALTYALNTLTLEEDAPSQAKYVLYLNDVSVDDFAVFAWALIHEPDLEDEPPFEETGFVEKIAILYCIATELNNVRYRDWSADMLLTHYDIFRSLPLGNIQRILEAASKSPPDDEVSIALQVTYCNVWKAQRGRLAAPDNTIQEAYKFAVDRGLKQLQGYITYTEVVRYCAWKARRRFRVKGPLLIDDVNEIEELCDELSHFWGQYRALPELPEDQEDLPPLVEGSADHRALKQIWRTLWEDGQRYDMSKHFPLAQMEIALRACENGNAFPLSNEGMAHLSCRAEMVHNHLSRRLGDIKGFSKDTPGKGGYAEASVDVGVEEEPEFSLGPPGSFPTSNCRPRTLTSTMF